MSFNQITHSSLILYYQAFWCLKMRCLTEQVYIDDLEADEEGIAESLMDEHSIATVARPGTSLRMATARPTQTSQAIRPVTASGRPLTGMLRTGHSGQTRHYGERTENSAHWKNIETHDIILGKIRPNGNGIDADPTGRPIHQFGSTQCGQIRCHPNTGQTTFRIHLLFREQYPSGVGVGGQGYRTQPV